VNYGLMFTCMTTFLGNEQLKTVYVDTVNALEKNLVVSFISCVVVHDIAADWRGMTATGCHNVEDGSLCIIDFPGSEENEQCDRTRK
jgi:hypothetical protein